MRALLVAFFPLYALFFGLLGIAVPKAVDDFGMSLTVLFVAAFALGLLVNGIQNKRKGLTIWGTVPSEPQPAQADADDDSAHYVEGE